MGFSYWKKIGISWKSIELRTQAKYGWTEQEMATYLFDYRLGYMISLWIIVPLLTNWLALSDNLIAIIACLLSAAGTVIRGNILLFDFLPHTRVEENIKL